ncbi:hypothetical protein J1N35_012698 [Gossypium stocksii]|uniref:Uncharacterized protein n=1 Tax=Gossypium stocksii TaxID=47602 RepID=A0A9D4AEL6_9ROSI|nr:hypothetical protein J1N35_012698 [Gossypium stocksii]
MKEADQSFHLFEGSLEADGEYTVESGYWVLKSGEQKGRQHVAELLWEAKGANERLDSKEVEKAKWERPKATWTKVNCDGGKGTNRSCNLE